MSNRPNRKPTPAIQPKDHVTLDGATAEYTVQAVSRAGRDVYVTGGDNTSIGTWVSIDSVALVAEVVR